MTPIQNRLKASIEATGLSVPEYAERILMRDERTVRRWLTGESPIPYPVRAFLQHADAGLALATAKDRDPKARTHLIENYWRTGGTPAD